MRKHRLRADVRGPARHPDAQALSRWERDPTVRRTAAPYLKLAIAVAVILTVPLHIFLPRLMSSLNGLTGLFITVAIVLAVGCIVMPRAQRAWADAYINQRRQAVSTHDPGPATTNIVAEDPPVRTDDGP